MSVLNNLRRTGRLSDAGAQLLYATVGAVARFSNMPPPTGHGSWTGDAVLEVAHDFLAHAQTPRRLTAIAVEASDDVSLERLLEAAVRNYLRDVARATDRGALMRRLRSVLTESEWFAQVPEGEPGAGWWMLDGGDGRLWAGNIDDLVAASWEAPGINAVRWSNAARRGPVAARATLERFLQGVLAEAAGAVPLAELARVAEQRFNVGPVVEVELGEANSPIHDPPPDEDVQDDIKTAWEELSTRERVILANHAMTVRELAEVVHLGKSAAAEARRQVEAKLRILLSETADSDAAALGLVEKSRLWLQDRTVDDGPTSDNTGNTTTTLDEGPPR